MSLYTTHPANPTPTHPVTEQHRLVPRALVRGRAGSGPQVQAGGVNWTCAAPEPSRSWKSPGQRCSSSCGLEPWGLKPISAEVLGSRNPNKSVRYTSPGPAVSLSIYKVSKTLPGDCSCLFLEPFPGKATSGHCSPADKAHLSAPCNGRLHSSPTPFIKKYCLLNTKGYICGPGQGRGSMEFPWKPNRAHLETGECTLRLWSKCMS